MSDWWNHSICEDCWNAQNPTKPARSVKTQGEQTCCFCGDKHSSGIYVRHDPASLKCGGEHKKGSEQ